MLPGRGRLPRGGEEGSARSADSADRGGSGALPLVDDRSERAGGRRSAHAQPAEVPPADLQHAPVELVHAERAHVGGQLLTVEAHASLGE